MCAGLRQLFHSHGLRRIKPYCGCLYKTDLKQFTVEETENILLPKFSRLENWWVLKALFHSNNM